MFDPFAAHSKEVEKSHLVDEFGGVIGIKEDVLAQLAFVEIFSHKPTTIFRGIFTPVVRFIHFQTLLVFVVIEGDGEVNLFRKDVIDLFSVIVDNVKVVIFCSLASVYHMKMLDF